MSVDATSFRHSYETVGGIKIHYVIEGDPSRPAILLVHGWPDFWWGFRRIIKPLAKAGYRVLVPDLPGFGESDCPTNCESYSLKNIVQILCGLLDALDIAKAVWFGHDHGGNIAWRACIHSPDRVIAVASLCTPYSPPKSVHVSLDQLVQILPVFRYQQYFNTDDAVKELDSIKRQALNHILRGSSDPYPGRFDAFLKHSDKIIFNSAEELPLSTMHTPDEFCYHVEAYKRTGFGPGLNLYRTHKINFEDEINAPSTIDKPALMITAGKDYILSPKLTAGMEKHIPKLERANISDANHWAAVEYSKELLQILVAWLKAVDIPLGKL